MENNISHLQAKLKGIAADGNKNKPAKVSNFTQQPQISRFTLHTSQLPKPQLPERVIETKTAKTLANNSRKILANLHSHGDTDSSKDGSLTEDSGVGSNTSSGNYDMQHIMNLDCSPLVRRNQKPRSLGVVVTGNKFDVKDFEDNSLVEDVSLPSLPSVALAPQNTGIVRERKLEYQWNLNRDNRRKISITSSEGFSDDFSANDNRDKYQNERNVSRPVPPVKTFLKPKRTSPLDSSSDDHDWAAGEAMVDDMSCSFSSSDDGKEREKHSISYVIHNLAQASIAKTQAKTVLLSIEDSKFAAVAAASTSGTLLQDETSPTDSLIGSYTESDEMHKNNKYNNRSSSDSKDINEKLSITPPSPGTPTHASNSLSLSDGKDFFVDDEIADQPALVFDDTVTNDNNTFNSKGSEGNSTLIESTPKLRRRSADNAKASPFTLRKKFLVHRSGSVDTLSPCESIASDDLMLDFEYSQSSGLDDLGDR